MRPRFIGLWRHQDFLKLWAGQTVSVFGTLITRVALPFTALLVLKANAAQMGLLVAAEIAPGFLAGLVAGVWVDRLRRRPVMMAADLGRAALLLSVPAAALFGALSLAQLYVVALLVGLLSVFFDVAYESYLPTLVRPEDVTEGNSKLDASASVAEVASFGLAGVLVQLFTAPGAILLDAISFVCSAWSIRAIRTLEPPVRGHEDRPGMLAEAREGLGVVARDPVLRALVVCAGALALSGGIVGTLWLLYISRDLHQNPTVIGLLAAAGGVGSFFGAIAAPHAARRLGLGRTLLLTLLVQTLGLLTLPLARGPELLVLAFLTGQQVLYDPARTIYEIHALSLRQTITPPRLQGRVSATLRVVMLGASLFGALTGGLLGEAVGVRPALLVATAWPLLAALWLLPTPLRRLREMPVLAQPSTP